MPVYQDLIGIPHERMHCYDLACAAAQRFGRRVPTLEEESLRARLEGERVDAGICDLPVADMPEPGDLVLIGEDKGASGIEHLGIVVEHGLMLHTLRGHRSRLSRLRHLQSRIHSIRRLPPC